MKCVFVVLSALAVAFAQDTTDMATMTEMTAVPTMTDATLASEMSLASCVTAGPYSSCLAGLTTGAPCTGVGQAAISCACSSASHAISCLNICSVSYDQSLIALVSTSCKSLAGIGVPTTAATAAQHTGANAAGAFLPRVTGAAAAGLAVAGGLAAFL